MDPPPAPAPAPPCTTATSDSLLDLPPLPTPTAKIRLLCSYGGHIIQRPHDKTLCYAGGDNRVVSVDRRTTISSLSALTSHLSRTLYGNRPFYLKYQLPNEELDSLISVTTDEDLQNMLEEHDRSTTSSRIRLFLFPVKPESLGSALLDSKADSWFSDALNNTRIARRGQSTDSGFGHELIGFENMGGSNEGQSENLSAKQGLESESMVLETSSSFGSTSSSISMSNLPAIGVQNEDGVGANLQDKRVRVPSSSASIDSDNSVGSTGFQPRVGIHQEPLVQVMSSMASHSLIESEGSMANPSLIQTPKMVQVSGYQLPQTLDGKQPQHGMHYLHGGACYVPHYPNGPLPVSSCYPFYQVPMQQPQQTPYPMNQQYPIYLVPVQQMQSHSMSVLPNINHASVIPSNRPPLPPQSVMSPPSIAYKEVMTAQSVPTISPPISAPSRAQQQYTTLPEPQLSSQPVSTASVPAANDANEFDDDLAYNQIYKSQPPPPSFISQCQTITKGATVLLSESSMQMHSNNVMNQAPSHPQ
ncbi:protein PAL OF QUIRKY [Lycium barbarum]|uniref:protein PAL OF QUIRKY n=1 Tax=Lycium barbarum TaxID=112863 RepID=UPI00293E1A23|nr:protein PAL OF QUIRKY [Lycium barbarum]